MPSLSQILPGNGPLLLLDAASERIQAGLLSAGREPRWASAREEAGTGIFACLDALGADVGGVGAFAFCEGPGSILGIRSAAMAIRAWCALRSRPVHAYLSLGLVAEAEGRDGLEVIADARRGLWHRLRRGRALERVPAAELGPDLATPEGFRHWAPLPPGTASCPYDLAVILGRRSVQEADLFREAPSPDAFLHHEPAYARWTPQIHRAP
jgi:tRNA threonylcarbamoyladenosine biosynthesis protein TsaB